jgi:hypothetical protein
VVALAATLALATVEAKPQRAGKHPRERAKNAECSAWNAGGAAVGVRCRWVRVGVAMTAHSPSSGAESASSTIDPDAEARRASDGELRQGFNLI